MRRSHSAIGVCVDNGDAPPPGRLLDCAAELHNSDKDGVWVLQYKNSAKLDYVDVAGVRSKICDWAERGKDAALTPDRPRAPSPLLISGLVKVRCCLRSN